MTEYTPDDFERIRSLATLLHAAPATIEALDRLAAQSAETRDLINQHNHAKGQLAVERQEHEARLKDMTAKHQAECEARKKELAALKINLDERERELAAGRRRVADQASANEQKAAYLGSRLRGVA
jgi:chromosome segregation ATPase